MRAARTFDVAASPESVFDYLSKPRNLILANQKGSTVEQSTDPVGGVGSWSVLAFDQLRVRIAYTAFDPPARIAAIAEYSGPGSGGRRDVADYRIAPAAGGRSSVTVEMESPGIPLIGRLVEWMVWRRLGQRLAAIN